MKKLLLVFLLYSSIAISQTAPTVYYRFDETNPLAPTVGSTNLTGGGSYTITTGGQVGKYISWNSNAGALMQGQSVSAGSSGTVQMLFKKGYYMDAGRDNRILTWGNLSIAIEWPRLIINVNATTLSYVLDGISRKSWSYLFNGNWHHLAFVYNGTNMQLWIDGRKCLDQAAAGGSFTGNVFFNSNTNYSKLRSDIDEIAVYTAALTGNQIYQNYLDAQGGVAYTTALAGSVPATESFVGVLDSSEFATGNQEASTQLQNYPLPRYKPGNTLLKNFNWQDPLFQGGAFQPRFSTAQNIANSLAIQAELANNWNYYYMIQFGTDAWSTGYVNAANLNPQWKFGIRLFRGQLFGNNCNLLSQTKANDHYLQNSGGAFIGTNGSPTSTKIWRPTAPVASYVGDGNQMLSQFSTLFTTLTRNIDWVNENGEIFPLITNTGLDTDPVVNSARIASGLTREQFLARKVAENDNQSFRNIFMAHPKLSAGKYTYYAVDGMNTWRHDYSEARKLNHTINSQYYSTPDFYIRWPDNWRYWQSAWHGWQWIVESRKTELGVGDELYSPFVSAGWDNVESNNVRPAQYLGLLKVLNITGAEFFYSGFFSLSAPWPDSRNWIWQAASSSYAQAIQSRTEDLLRNGSLMSGDVPDNYVTAANPGYSFYSGDIRKLVAARKHDTLNKYVIAGTFQNNSNLGGTEQSGPATIKIGGDSLIFTVRRQGSVYIYDKTVSPSVFYQLDTWHDSTHYERWSKDFDFEAEVYDNNATGVVLKTFAAWPNLTNFRTYLTFAGANQVQYNFQPRTTTTYYVYVLARTQAMNDSTGFTLQLDNGTTKTISCIVDTTWKWYKYNTADGIAVFYPDVSPANHMLKLTSVNNKLQVDRVVLSLNNNLFASTPTSCAAAPPVPPVATITPSGPLSFCQGGSVTLTANSATSYLWNTGATTQSIVASTSGTYIVTITTAAGSDASDPVSVNAMPLPLGTVTPSGSTTLCTGQSVTLTSSSASGYLWNTGQTTQAISVNVAGTYTVTITGSNGCSAAVTPGTVVTVMSCGGLQAPTNVVATPVVRWYAAGATITWDHIPNDATGFQLELWNTGGTSVNKTTVGGAVRSKSYDWLRYKANYTFRIRSVKNGVYSNWVQISFKVN